MAADFSLPLRKGVVDDLRAAATAVAERVYGPQPPAKPTWPYSRVEPIVTTPLRATGIDGGDHRFTVHGFFKGADDPNAAGWAFASDVKERLNGARIPLDLPADAKLAHIGWLSNQVVPDGDEAGAWHAICEYTARIVAVAA